jgi:hypothetical protein
MQRRLTFATLLLALALPARAAELWVSPGERQATGCG